MAASFSAYFLTHAPGENRQRKRVSHLVQMFAQIGDCGFDSPITTGRPTSASGRPVGLRRRREPASRAASSKLFAAHFERVFPYLVRPDATDVQITADATAPGS
ncbi:hypothetical protein F1D05_23920 [Kribbella qitaiheensis]|uniref:Uncharacterized protein n=1 Tax=Kribbella qitaiheensis TaxID=1544730 RepID=A0A7G6X2D0_9ACTN|nr:hypothetical protein [Kribbella qitaiheensis]QNE20395.1 hypothetical protein F1D05_23920 [Kribbella qitaiheensis]